MTSKQIMKNYFENAGAFTPKAYSLMFEALLEIGFDWEAEIKAYPYMDGAAWNLEWLSGVLKEITGMTWEELTDDN